jgi:hypothetical protein
MLFSCYDFHLYRKKGKPSLNIDIYCFMVFLPKLFDTSRWNHIMENFSGWMYGHINSISIGLKESLVHIRILIVISRFLHKIFEIFWWNLRMEKCRRGSYGTMCFNFIEREDCLVYILIFRVICNFLLNVLANLVEIASWRIAVTALMVILILTQLY